MRLRSLLGASALALLLLAGCSSTGQMTEADSPSTEPPQESGEEKNEFAEAIAESDSLGGLFTVYRDTSDGSLQMALDTSQIGEEFIYFTHTVDGVLEAGTFRGNYRDNTVFKVRRHYDKIEFVELNTNFHFNEESTLTRAADANVSPSVLHVENIVAEDDSTGRVLIGADDLFLTESLTQVKPSPAPGQESGGFDLGRHSKEKSKVQDVHNYPKNTDVVVDYVFENQYPTTPGSDAVTDARNVTITLRHSLIEVPDNDFKPRFADPRIGFFTQEKDDLTSTSATPYHDLINRWHLEKKDPDAELSEPVEPITWWIENTTPERIRPIIRDAVLEWNDAFREAGFKNAIEVKVQPDTASWDAGDIRYNVLRWTSSPNPPFSGYGPSFVNPHTGQILGADVMLEYAFLTNQVAQNKLFDEAGLPLEAADAPDFLPEHACTLPGFLHMNTLFGKAALETDAADPSPEQNGPSDLDGEMTQLMEEALHFLVLHEVGHTLGLQHNMKSSQLHGADEVHDASVTREEGLTGSVMDYPAVNVAPPDTEQGQYYTTRPGPYDEWALEYGYTPDASEEALDAILSRSTDPDLAFGNDADDMRAPGKAIDPEVMVGDMSNEALTYAEDRMALVENLMDGLLEKYEDPGQSYEELRNAFLSVTGQHAQMAAVASRYVGGVYVDRALIGQEDATEPYRPVSLETQQRALDLLDEHLFAPDAFNIVPEELFRHLQPQRRGFNFSGETEDPKVHARVLNIQESVLAHLLHPTVLERMTDTRLYGNEYDLATYMQDLTDTVFGADAQGNVNSFRQNLQVSYVESLATVVGEEGNAQYDNVAQSAALQSLRQIERMVERKRGVNAETRAHTDHVLHLIDTATATD
ncbi:MAG: zinc-dependent metalloprotease [Salinivenus sp.]